MQVFGKKFEKSKMEGESGIFVNNIGELNLKPTVEDQEPKQGKSYG